jgi:hypothetical protein
MKAMLTKVCAGKKRFHFAYGTGKRKDGKGDGELLVRGKKLKKQDVEPACECNDFLLGLCWSSPDGATVFFQATGKKLSQTLVAKMALTAKRVLGKQYDFQLPSPEEEARASTLAEGDEGSDSAPDATTKPAAPAQGEPSADALAAWQAAREAVVVDIRKAAAAIAATRDPHATAAIIELQAIIKNLTAKPQTPQAVAELERYLKTDDIITHAEDIPRWVATLRIREPLLGALKRLQA